MKYPASRLTPFLAAVTQNFPHCLLAHSRVSRIAQPLSSRASMPCALLFTLSLEGNSLVALFSTAVVCFQELAHSFAKTPGVGVPRAVPSLLSDPLSRAPFTRGNSISGRLCFQELTNPFSRNLFLFTSIQNAGGVASAGLLGRRPGVASSAHQPELRGEGPEKASGSNGEPELQGMHITAERIDRYGTDYRSARMATSNVE